jgi:hypothetical protein
MHTTGPYADDLARDKAQQGGWGDKFYSVAQSTRVSRDKVFDCGRGAGIAGSHAEDRKSN